MREPDEAYRLRLLAAYGMWGAISTVIMEASGQELDELNVTLELACPRKVDE